jgi:hypothetical protein
MTSCVRRARALMERSRSQHFAVGEFNVDNQGTLLTIARAASVNHAPVLVELSHAEADLVRLANLRSLVDKCCAEYDVEMDRLPAPPTGVQAAPRRRDPRRLRRVEAGWGGPSPYLPGMAIHLEGRFGSRADRDGLLEAARRFLASEPRVARQEHRPAQR